MTYKVKLDNQNGYKVSAGLAASTTDTITIETNDTNNRIPAGKVVVVSVVPVIAPSVEAALDPTKPDDADLLNYPIMVSVLRNGQNITSNIFGQNQYPFAKTGMTYIKTTALAGPYTINVTTKPNMRLSSYTVYAVTVDSIGSFLKCNVDSVTADNPSDSGTDKDPAKNTYMISNDPENLYTGTLCTGANSIYLCRGRIGSYARIYFEHINRTGNAMRFGVLLHNRGTNALQVTVVNRSVKKGRLESDIASATLGIWESIFNGNIEKDDSDFPNTTQTTKSLSAGSPLWISLSTIENTYDVFNGVISIKITDANGNLYLGNDVFCDTYAMGINSTLKTTIKNNVSTMRPAASAGYDALRGSGNGAVLFTDVSGEKTVSASSPYKILIAGHAMPVLQGAEISVSNLGKTYGVESSIKNCFNYGVLYRIRFLEGIKPAASGASVKLKIGCNKRTNPNAAAMKEGTTDIPGVYVVGFWGGYWGSDTNHFSVLAKAGEEFEVYRASSIPKNAILNLVVSGMSSMPPEITFCT